MSGAAALGLAALTTNALSTHGRGTYAILGTSAGVAAMITTGSQTVLAADLIHMRRDEALLHGVSLAIAVYSALLLALVAVGAALITGSGLLAALLGAAAVVALVTYSNFVMYLAQARGDVTRVSLALVGKALLPLLTALAAVAMFRPTVTALMVAWAVGSLVMASLQFWDMIATGGLAVKRAWGLAISTLRRSAGVSMSNAVTLLCTRIDVLVVAAVLSVSAAGVYSIPVALSLSLLELSRSLLTATYRSIMTAPERDVSGRLSLAVRHSVLMVLAGGCLSLPVVWFGAGFVFGRAYSGIWPEYAILVLGAACACVNEILRHFLLIRLERQRELVIVNSGMLIINGVLAVAGATAFGLAGAAASTAITYACGAVALVAVCARSLSLPMRTLAVPRRSDLASYWRMVRLILARFRSMRSVP